MKGELILGNEEVQSFLHAVDLMSDIVLSNTTVNSFFRLYKKSTKQKQEKSNGYSDKIS